VPAAWTVPALILDTPTVAGGGNDVNHDNISCTSKSVLEALKSLPPSTILADSDLTGFILEKTKHRALSGNYHRNWRGISAGIEIAISNTQKSQQLLAEHKVDYIYYCSASTGAQIYKSHNAEGLIAKLAEGEVPTYLEAMPSLNLERDGAMILKVKQP